MPPSGYSKSQSDSIVEFLRSCGSALEDEAASLAESYVDALGRERAGIAASLIDKPQPLAAKMVLELTLCFYDSVFKKNPYSKEEFWDAVDESLAKIESQILAIKVDIVISP